MNGRLSKSRVASIVGFLVFGITLAAVMLSCSGDDSGSSVQFLSQTAEQIGPDGGALELPRGGVITFPSGALGEVQIITAQTIDAPQDPSFSALSTFFEFSPSGLQFKSGVSLEIPSVPLLLGQIGVSQAPNVGIYYTDESGKFQFQPSSVDLDSGVVTTNVRHFSQGGVGLSTSTQVQCCLENGSCSNTSRVGCNGIGVVAGFGSCSETTTVCENIVCCQDGDYFFTAQRGNCLSLGGAPRADAECDTVCCFDSRNDDSAGRITSRANCLSQGEFVQELSLGCERIVVVPSPAATTSSGDRNDDDNKGQGQSSSATFSSESPKSSSSSSRRTQTSSTSSASISSSLSSSSALSSSSSSSDSSSSSSSSTPTELVCTCQEGTIVPTENDDCFVQNPEEPLGCVEWSGLAADTFPDSDPFGPFPSGTIVGSQGCGLQLFCNF